MPGPGDYSLVGTPNPDDPRYGPGWQYDYTDPRGSVIQWLREHGMWNPFSRAGNKMATGAAGGITPSFLQSLMGQTGDMQSVQGQFGDFMNQWMTGQQQPMGMQSAQQALGGMGDKVRDFQQWSSMNMPGADMASPEGRTKALEGFMGQRP